FPTVTSGFDVIVGNPPYAAVGDRSALHELSGEFRSFSPESAIRDNLYPLFVETMWRLADVRHHASGLVVPLSIAYHRSHQLVACRRAMRDVGGHWHCAFFDREPHALFGEDVKTRNAILFHTAHRDDPNRGRAAIY